MAVATCKNHLCNYILKPSFKACTQFFRLKHDVHVVMTDDSSMVVCWHPETFFPYEMTLPIPEKVELKSDSVLKVQSNKELLSVFKPKREAVMVQELSSITHTTKHIWFPRGKRQFKKKTSLPEMDRPYL